MASLNDIINKVGYTSTQKYKEELQIKKAEQQKNIRLQNIQKEYNKRKKKENLRIYTISIAIAIVATIFILLYYIKNTQINNEIVNIIESEQFLESDEEVKTFLDTAHTGDIAIVHGTFEANKVYEIDGIKASIIKKYKPAILLENITDYYNLLGLKINASSMDFNSITPIEIQRNSITYTLIPDTFMAKAIIEKTDNSYEVIEASKNLENKYTKISNILIYAIAVIIAIITMMTILGLIYIVIEYNT